VGGEDPIWPQGPTESAPTGRPTRVAMRPSCVGARRTPRFRWISTRCALGPARSHRDQSAAESYMLILVQSDSVGWS